MTPFSQARALALSVIEPARSVRLPLFSANGLFISENIDAGRALPAVDNSAMDGYAVKSSETRGANRDRPAQLRLVDSITAGMLPGRFINTGEAARIFTGAALPPGTDAVVRQEAAQTADGYAYIYAEAEPGENVRRRGEEIRQGQHLFSATQRVTPYVIGTLASMGMSTVPVRPKPRVAIVTIGDELAAPGQNASAHQVYDANGPLLAALAQEAGADVVSIGRVPDSDDAIKAALEKRLETAELIITSGGASVGDKDRVKKVVQQMRGKLAFDGVAMKPGKPVAVGTLAGRPIAILPGNPGATACAFDQLVRPMLLRRQGVQETRRRIPVKLQEEHRKQPAMIYFLAGQLLAADEGGVPGALVPPQGSNQLFASVGSVGWVLLPSGRPSFDPGEVVEMELYDSPTYEVSR